MSDGTPNDHALAETDRGLIIFYPGKGAYHEPYFKLKAA